MGEKYPTNNKLQITCQFFTLIELWFYSKPNLEQIFNRYKLSSLLKIPWNWLKSYYLENFSNRYIFRLQSIVHKSHNTFNLRIMWLYSDYKAFYDNLTELIRFPMHVHRMDNGIWYRFQRDSCSIWMLKFIQITHFNQFNRIVHQIDFMQ